MGSLADATVILEKAGHEVQFWPYHPCQDQNTLNAIYLPTSLKTRDTGLNGWIKPSTSYRTGSGAKLMLQQQHPLTSRSGILLPLPLTRKSSRQARPRRLCRRIIVPLVFLHHGSNDDLVPCRQARRVYVALGAEGVEVGLLSLRELTFCFDMLYGTRAREGSGKL